MIKFLSGGGWVIPVALALFGWYQSSIKAAERRGELLADIRVLQADRSLLTDQVANGQLLQSNLRDSLASLEAVRDSLRVQTHLSTVRALEARSRLDSALLNVPDTVRVQVFDTIRRFEEQFDACQLELRNCEERVRVVTESRDSALVLIPRLDSLSQRQNLAIDALRKKLRPNIVKSALPWAIAVLGFLVLR